MTTYTITQYKIIQKILWYNADLVAVIIQKPKGVLDYYSYRIGITAFICKIT